GCAEMAVVGYVRKCCGKSADVAGPYLVARCPRAGTDLRFGDSGGDFAENGGVWLSAFLATHATRGFGLLRTVDFRLVDCGDCLYVAGRADAGRYEKADCLFFCCAYGLCHGGDFRHEPTRYRRGDYPDD